LANHSVRWNCSRSFKALRLVGAEGFRHDAWA
jgi:hypothetical protein